MTGSGTAPHLPTLAPIDAYGAGGFRFAGMSHRGSLLCLPGGIWAWPVTTPEDIDAEALAAALADHLPLDFLILGTGGQVWLPPARLRERLRLLPVQLDAMQTGPAVRTFNVLVAEGRRIAAALIAVD